MAVTNKYIREIRLMAELMATLETILAYCPNKSVKAQAAERYRQLRADNDEWQPQPPLGDYQLKEKFINHSKINSETI